MSTPRLPDAPRDYNAGFMAQFINALRAYFVQLEAVRHVNLASANFNLDTLPSSATGLRDGDVYRDSGVLVVAGAGGSPYLSSAYLDVQSNPQTTPYVLALSDRGKSVDTSAQVTVPLYATVPFPVGSTVTVSNTTSGTISLVPEGALTLRKGGTLTSGTLSILPYGAVTVRRMPASDTWHAFGSLA